MCFRTGLGDAGFAIFTSRVIQYYNTQAYRRFFDSPWAGEILNPEGELIHNSVPRSTLCGSNVHALSRCSLTYVVNTR